MISPAPSYIPTPEQIEALAAGLHRVGLVAQRMADDMAEAFAAVRQMELKRRSRLIASWWSHAWLMASRPDPTIGRKRRRRRARGRRIEARQAPGRKIHVAAEQTDV